ncbi:MAG: PilZ domain-containing protein [Myxococcales bacterium]|nr:PilZ domain-containing protein [Myxococcales bacterium]
MPSERRSGPRVVYNGEAVVYAAERQLACRARDLSTSGMLIFPPARARPGLQMRIAFSFPGMGEQMVVQATLVREAMVEGHYAWGVRFDAMAPHMGTMLRTFVRRMMRGEPEPDLAMSAAAQPLIAGTGAAIGAPAGRPPGAPPAASASRPRADASQPHVRDGSQPYGSGSQLRADGSQPRADGSQPGSQPRVGAASRPRADASHPRIRGDASQSRIRATGPTRPVPVEATGPAPAFQDVPPGPEPLKVEETDPFADLPVGGAMGARDVAESDVDLFDARADEEDTGDLWDDNNINLRRLYKDAVDDVAGPKKDKKKKKGWFSR